MTAKDFHVGQTIYIGSIVRTDLNGGLNLATVTSIRRKWITFTYLFDGYSKGRFAIESGLVDNGAYSPDKVVVLDPEEYYDAIDARRLRCAIAMNTRVFEKCTAEQLKEIARIANIQVKFCERKYKAEENA